MTRQSLRLLRSMVLVMAVIAGMLLFPCCSEGDRQENRTNTPDRGVVLCSLSKYDALNPVTSRDVATGNVLRFLLNPTLLMEDPDSVTLIPWLAQEMPVISQDRKALLWTLHENATWQDGRPVTSADALFTWAMLNAEENKAGGRLAELGPVDRLEVVDQSTFRVVYSQPHPAAAKGFGIHFGLVPAHKGPDDPVKFSKVRQTLHCGPYKVVSWDDDELVMVRHDRWWGEGLPRFEGRFRALRIVKKFVNDSFQIREQLLAGILDLAPVRKFENYLGKFKGVRWDENFDRAHFHVPGWSYIGWNCRHPLFSDARVRRALAHMMRRDEVNRSFYGGHAKPVSGPWFFRSAYYDKELEPLRFDPPTASRLLAEAGWNDSDGDGFLDRNGRHFSFTLSRIPGDLGWINGPLAHFGDDLAQIGIEMKVEVLDYGKALLPKVSRGEHEAYMLIWRVDAILPDLYPLLHSSQVDGGYNWQGYSNPQVDRLLEEYRITTDEQVRISKARAIHRRLHEDQPICFLYNGPTGVIWNKRLKGVNVHALGLREWDFALDRDQ